MVSFDQNTRLLSINTQFFVYVLDSRDTDIVYLTIRPKAKDQDSVVYMQEAAGLQQICIVKI